MCQACINKIKSNARPTDVFKPEDIDLEKFYEEGFDVQETVKSIYYSICNDPSNMPLKLAFHLVAATYYGVAGAALFQTVRDVEEQTKAGATTH